ncbi:MAG: hypothetical protein CVT49_11080 [candidate division Zixibacteria bacterium HGW-Zixibacteria-1]|nr:MAG: hypothetical protein CVT49_11080 [candidate division Zixibacteria bacterium HGW-Zixibacteria-1]
MYSENRHKIKSGSYIEGREWFPPFFYNLQKGYRLDAIWGNLLVKNPEPTKRIQDLTQLLFFSFRVFTIKKGLFDNYDHRENRKTACNNISDERLIYIPDIY